MRREMLPKPITVLSLIWPSQSHADLITDINKMLREQDGGNRRSDRRIKKEILQQRYRGEGEDMQTPPPKKTEKMRKNESKDKRERQWKEDQREEE